MTLESSLRMFLTSPTCFEAVEELRQEAGNASMTVGFVASRETRSLLQHICILYILYIYYILYMIYIIYYI